MVWPQSSKKIARQATLQLDDNISNVSLIKDESNLSSLGPPPEAKLGLRAALRRYPRITLYSALLTSTILLWGYDGSVVGGVSSMPEFQKVFGVAEGDRWIIPSEWLSVWNIGSPIGGMFGSVVAGWLGDIIGRRWTLSISTILSAGAVMLCMTADTPTTIGGRRGLFLVAKTIQGLAIGGVQTMTQTYISEIVPQQLRGSILPLFPAFNLLGNIVGSVIVQIQMDVVGRNSYRVLFATQWAFSVIPLIASFVIPESPAWLLRKGKVERARRNNQRLEHSKRLPNAHILSFNKLQKTIAQEKVKSGENIRYIDCFRGTDFRRTGLVMFMNVVPDFFGMSLLGSAGYVLQQIGQDPKTANLFFIAGIALGLVGNLGTFYTLSRVGRRLIVLVTLSIITVLWLAVGVAGTIRKTGEATIWFSSVAMTLVIFTASLGVWPASYVISAETSSLRLRSRTQGIGWTISNISGVAFGFSMPYAYNPDAANLGGMTAYIFVGFAGLALAISWFCLPEMKDRSIQEIDRMFELRLPARDFKKWHGNVDTDMEFAGKRGSVASEETVYEGVYEGGYGRIAEEDERV